MIAPHWVGTATLVEPLVMPPLAKRTKTRVVAGLKRTVP
jgi:hypothetical protein